MSAPTWYVVLFWTVNMAFSIWTGTGMDSIMATRSSCGVDAFRVVGAMWVDGYTALSSWLCAWLVLAGAGRARGTYTSSISVSLDGTEVAYCVFLVFTGIFCKKRVQVYNNVRNFNFGLLAYTMCDNVV